jgi:RNA polymerase sigma-B factor
MAPSSVAPRRPTGSGPQRDVVELFEHYRTTRDPADREALVERFLPLARQLSRKYFAAGEREDLEQVASVGLLKAIDRFDPARGIAFTSFALPTILGELKRYFRDLGWSVRVPRSLQELRQHVDEATEELLSELGRPPTVTEVAQHCGATPERVLEARDLGTAHRAISLDVPATDDESGCRLQAIGADDDGFDRVESAVDVERLLDCLEARDRVILRLRFQDDLTQREIAARTGLSQMHVSRLLRAALEHLSRQALASV